MPVLLEHGCSVLSVVRSAADPPPSSLPRLEHHLDDGDQAALVTRVAQFEPDSCVHLATAWIAKPGPAEFSRMVDSNLAFGIRVVNAFEQAGGRGFVNARSYMQNRRSTTTRAMNEYAALKNSFEDYVDWHASRGGLRVLHLELFDTFLPRDDRRTVWQRFIDAASSTAPFPTTTGDQLVAPLHVNDAARGFAQALHCLSTQAGQRSEYHLAGDEVVRLRDALSLLAEISGRGTEMRWGEVPYSGTELFDWVPTGPRLPGWSPQWTLREGLEDIWTQREVRSA